MQTKYHPYQMNDIYPLDIWYVIFQHLDLLSKLRLISVCSAFNRSFFITDMYDVADIYKDRLTKQILKQRKFERIISLDIHLCNINNISFLINLKKLNTYNIDQEGIKGLNLIELYAGCNEKIKDVSFMTNLKKLHASGCCGIDQKGIKGCNLIELDANYNEKIKNVSFMTNLKKLYAFGNCGIDQNSIKGLDLITLDVGCNKKIKDVSFMTNLKKLRASENCGIDQEGIRGLDLIELDVNSNDKINDVSFMTSLKKLNGVYYAL